MLQGQRDQKTVARLLMSEVTPLVAAHHGAFYVAEDTGEDEETELRLIAHVRLQGAQDDLEPLQDRRGARSGRPRSERKAIVITQAPEDYIKIASGLGEAAPTSIIVLPVLFEETVMAVIELASFDAVHGGPADASSSSSGVDRRRPEHDHREHAHRGAAAPVAAADRRICRASPRSCSRSRTS